MRQSTSGKALIILYGLSLSACASLQEKLPFFNTNTPTQQATHAYTPAQMHEQHMALIADIEQFSLKGRMGIQAEGKGYSVGTQWTHQPAQNAIKILSPIGSEVANIESNADEVRLTTQEGKVFAAKDAETLTQDTLGWKLPMQGLEDWALGRPTKKLAEKIEWDMQGRITSMLQNGWKIEYPEYVQVGNYALPKKIFLTHPKLTLKMVVEHWSQASAMQNQDTQSPQ